MGFTAAHAQQQFATLQHGDNISVFYGYSAFVEAHAAAVNGDIITLSPGSFYNDHITKAVTIRGAGMRRDTVANTFPTKIIDNPNNYDYFTINVDDNTAHILDIEGIYFDTYPFYEYLKNARFNKCQMAKEFGNDYYAYDYTQQQVMNGCVFSNCIFNENLYIYPDCSLNTFVNCVISSIESTDNSDNNNTYVHCVITGADYNNGTYYSCVNVLYDDVEGASCYNCLFVKNSNYGDLSAETSANNYLAPNVGDAAFSSVFATLQNSNQIHGMTTLSTEMFELTEAASAYIGHDGTQVGVHGGLFPFNPRVSTYRVSVPQGSTSEGNLEVGIQNVNE